MSWAGYLVLAFAALLLGQILWVKLGSKRMQGRAVDDLAAVFPDLEGHRGRAVIYCHSAHCGACRRITPQLEALAAADPRIHRLDLGTHAGAARALGVRATPTSLLIEDGRIVKVVLGDPLRTIQGFLREDAPSPP